MDKKDLTELSSEEKEKPVTWGELVEVAKMFGEEVNKLADQRVDIEKNATDEIMQMIIDSMNTVLFFCCSSCAMLIDGITRRCCRLMTTLDGRWKIRRKHDV